MDEFILFDSVEPDCYPGTNVLINKLNIKSFALLETAEADFTAIRSLELFQTPSQVYQSFDFQHLKGIHSYLFQDLYSWVGLYFRREGSYLNLFLVDYLIFCTMGPGSPSSHGMT